MQASLGGMEVRVNHRDVLLTNLRAIHVAQDVPRAFQKWFL